MSASENPSRCITCGRAATPEIALEPLASGELCTGCHDRLLAEQPPLLPGFGNVPSEDTAVAAVEVAGEASEDREELRGDVESAPSLSEPQPVAEELARRRADLTRTEFRLLEGGGANRGDNTPA